METLTNAYQIISTHGFAEVRLHADTNEKSLHALQQFQENEIITHFEAGELKSHPTYLTIQIGEDQHITLQPEFLQYINHSCDPNVFFDTEKMQLICIRSIEAEEELKFFYPSTEWIMTQPFVCNCRSSKCLQMIHGAAFIKKEVIANYKLTLFIQQQLHHTNI